MKYRFGFKSVVPIAHYSTVADSDHVGSNPGEYGWHVQCEAGRRYTAPPTPHTPEPQAKTRARRSELRPPNQKSDANFDIVRIPLWRSAMTALPRASSRVNQQVTPRASTATTRLTGTSAEHQAMPTEQLDKQRGVAGATSSPPVATAAVSGWVGKSQEFCPLGFRRYVRPT